jgi:mono/diheme cytochrome c family protein
MKKLVLGITVLLLMIALAIGIGAFKVGLVPVNADVPPSGLETRFIPIAVHASVAHNAEEQPNPVDPTDENLIAGGEIYTELCARCHGIPGKAPSVLGASFYPPAPQFTVQPSTYTEGELFWIVKHGIRNTGMPAWGRLLTDQDIWRTVAVLRRLNSLPSAVETSLKEGHYEGNQ